jgi:hypothetical protein
VWQKACFGHQKEIGVARLAADSTAENEYFYHTQYLINFFKIMAQVKFQHIDPTGLASTHGWADTTPV